MTKQKGFTLIELVTVIIILGILAAFAVPRFINLTSSARAATIDGLAGSVRAASALAHAAYIVKGDEPTAVTMDGASVTLTHGYPAASDAGIKAALQGGGNFTDSGTAPYEMGLTGDGATPKSDCKVQYTAATTTTAPVIAVLDTCS